jgi:hypothetical protein
MQHKVVSGTQRFYSNEVIRVHLLSHSPFCPRFPPTHGRPLGLLPPSGLLPGGELLLRDSDQLHLGMTRIHVQSNPDFSALVLIGGTRHLPNPQTQPRGISAIGRAREGQPLQPRRSRGNGA